MSNSEISYNSAMHFTLCNTLSLKEKHEATDIASEWEWTWEHESNIKRDLKN